MSSKPENVFIASINRLLPIKKVKASTRAREKYDKSLWIHYEKMNNPFRGGTADGWYSGSTSDLWIEYKFLPRIPRSGVAPQNLLSTLQLDWLKERSEEGRKVYVIIGCAEGGVLLRDREWEHELTSSCFTSLIHSRADLAEWIMEQTTR